MRKSLRISGLLAALLLAWGEVHAAGLGRLSVQSALGQPLQAEIELLSVSKDELNSISARLASNEAFRQARIERQEVLNALRFSVVQKPNGQPIIWITSNAPISDPFVDLLIELNWASGRLLREYTVLLDPPREAKVAQAAQPVPVAPPVSAPVAETKPAKAMPAEKPAAETKAKPEKAAAKEYGPVKGGETLRSIAGRVKPAEATLEQMMVALYQANRSAFQGDNMNRLMKGRVLKVPDVDNIMLTTYPSQARKMLSEHTREWHASRQQAEREAPMAEQPKDKAAAKGKIETAKAPEKPAPAVAPKDVLKLSKGEPAGVGKPDAKAMERLSAVEEELAAKSRALKEAQDRVTQLERTVQDMQKLLALQSQQTAAAAPKAEAKPEPEAPAAPVQPVPAAAPAPAPVPQPEPSLVDKLMENPAYLGGGLAGILLLALIGLRAKQRRKQTMPAMAMGTVDTGAPSIPPETLPPNMFAPATEGAATPSQTTESSILTDFSRLGLGSIDTQEIDPIAEAEVYLAYGRDAQAEEILREALAKAPGRQDILQKLLEIYHARKDTRAYESTARDLQSALGGEATPVWNRAAEMGREIDPGNPLYQAGAAAAAVAAATAAAIAEPSLMAAPEAAPVMPEIQEPAVPEPEPAEPPAAKTGDTGAGDLDFEFSMDLPPEEETPAEPSAPAAEEALDFESAMGGFEPEPEKLEEEALSFESTPETAAAEAPRLETEVAQPEELTLGEDLDFTADFETAPSETKAEAKPEQEVPMADLDFSGIDLELEEAPAEEIEMGAAPAAEPTLELGQGADVGGEVDSELQAEVNAKLDLARAYLEMGDKEGAREILQEVLSEGDSQQKAEADKLMAEAV